MDIYCYLYSIHLKIVNAFFPSGWLFSCCRDFCKADNEYLPTNTTMKEMNLKNDTETSPNKVSAKKYDAVKIQLNSVTLLEAQDGNMITKDSQIIF